MDGQRRAPAAASVASVLGDDDLLREILLRLGFPNGLVRASLVSKRWLSHASDPAFLRRFRERNPPRLLGFCLRCPDGYSFVPLPQPPELAVPMRRATSSSFIEMFLPEDGGLQGITLVHLWMVGRKIYAEVCVLGSGGWCAPTTAVTEVELPVPAHRYAGEFLDDMLPPVHGKVFMVTRAGTGYTLGLDFAAVRFFTLELPVGVQINYKLSYAEDSGLYLVSADGFQLSVWIHPMIGDDNAAGNWRLVDTFCVREACTRLVDRIWLPLDNFIAVDLFGDNADFVILDHPATGILFYVHLRSRVVEKVYERPLQRSIITPAYGHLHISPVMMTWPPIFPTRNIGYDQEE